MLPMRFPLIVLLVITLLASCGSPPPTLAPKNGGIEGPVSKGPTPEELERLLGNDEKDYPLYPGDLLRITVQGHEDLTIERKIPASGRIPLYGLDTTDADGGNPRVTEVDVAGLRLPQLEQKLATLYKRIVNPPYVTVKVVQFAPKVIYVAGAVGGPRDYRLPDETRISLVQALTMAGWFTEDAAKDRVRVIRVDPQTGDRVHLPAIDVTKIISSGDSAWDILLLPGDTITVDSHESKTVSIFGHVERPGEYPWSPGMTLTRLITISGGLRTFAKMTNIRVLRSGVGGKEEDGAYHVDLKAVLDGEEPDYELEPGDRIWVDERFI